MSTKGKTKIRRIENELLGEEFFEIEHFSGLRIFVYPKEGYASSYAVFGTNYGSIDSFLEDKDGKAIPIAEGTAHFLEHKLFESEELDAFERFARTGAQANAYTTFDKTCYLFSCSTNFSENLRILLDFVKHPYFTEQSVKKEQGIIGQEIKMYRDEPSFRILFDLFGILYGRHPVRTDIAGSEESISKITAELLYSCYDSFYRNENMVLAVAGKVSTDEVLSAADKLLSEEKGKKLSRPEIDEGPEAVKKTSESRLSVAQPIFALGYKEEPLRGSSQELLFDRIVTSLLLEYIAGDVSPLYRRLMDAGLINRGFSSEYFCCHCCSAIIFSGESRAPKEAAALIREEIARLKSEGIDGEAFEGLKKMYYGRAVRGYDYTEELANEAVSAFFEGYRLFDELEMLKKVSVKDAKARLQRGFHEEGSGLALILPS